MGHSTLHCAKSVEPIDMPFWIKTRVGPWNHVLDGGADPQGNGQFSVVVWAIQKSSIGSLHCNGFCSVTAKGIMQSPITSCSRRDHSVCQANANSIRKISGRGRCSLLAAKGVVTCTAWQSLISTIALFSYQWFVNQYLIYVVYLIFFITYLIVISLLCVLLSPNYEQATLCVTAARMAVLDFDVLGMLNRYLAKIVMLHFFKQRCSDLNHDLQPLYIIWSWWMLHSCLATYRLLGCNSPWFICWFRHYIKRLRNYFLTYLLP